MDRQLLERLLPEVGTPAYIFDLDEFRERARLVKEFFGVGTELCFSVKANPFLLKDFAGKNGAERIDSGKTSVGGSASGTGRHAGDLFGKVEVCSPGELVICERLGIPAQKIIFSGVNKTAGDIRRALEYKGGRASGIADSSASCAAHPETLLEAGDADPEALLAANAMACAQAGVGTFTAESLLQLGMISRSAQSIGRRVPVLLRVSDGSQFGMDENDVLELFRRRTEYPGADFAGLHFFTGTQKRRSAQIIKELGYISGLADRIREKTGSAMRRIEYGTGLAVDYFKENADDLERERLAAVAGKVREVAERYDLTIEMGRFFAAPCGYYLTKAADTKRNSGIRYVILDGGLHQLKYDGQLQGMQIPPILHIKGGNGPESGCRPEREYGLNSGRTPENAASPGSRKQGAQPGQSAAAGVQKWTLAGSLCTTADILARDVELDSLETGDILVFCRTGAYSVTEGMAAFLSRDLPAVALYSETDGLRVVRRRVETAELNTPL